MKNNHFLLSLPVWGSLLVLAQCGSPAGEIPSAEGTYYQEPYRPQFHFSPEEKWMNDPNGMVYYDGEYHLFYQYYPDSTVWGPMHWGHAVSTDLLHWTHLPIALYPDSLGYIFSGSAVIDWNNTSGLGTADTPPMVAVFTHHLEEGARAGRIDFQYQSIAYSLDRGRTWTKYAGNPVLPNPGIRDFRDPKVSWHEPSRQWVMVLAALDRVHFYTSPNLRDWTFASEFGADRGSHGGVWECPDLFPLPPDGDAARTRWVLLLSINPGGPNGGSATQYFVGDFDGKTFTLDPAFDQAVRGERAVWIDHGRDNYAGVTWSDIPASDGRRLFLGWMSNWDYGQAVPTAPWRSAMTIPRELRLRTTPDGPRLVAQPVRELDLIAGPTTEKKFPTPQDSTIDLTQALGLAMAPMELDLAFLIPQDARAETCGIRLENDRGEHLDIGFDVATNRYYLDRRRAGPGDFSDKFASIDYAPRSSLSDTLRMRLLIDRSNVELFADEGQTVMTSLFFPGKGSYDRITAFAEGGKVYLPLVRARALASVWR